MDTNQKTTMPFVTALLVVRNEEQYIETSLLSLIHQTYPETLYEILVVDGCSADGTTEKVRKIQEKYADRGTSIRILRNPKKILSSGWNVGIKEARGEYIVRFDAHGEVADDFIAQNVETMLRVDAAVVGGRLVTELDQGADEAVAKVLSSPFGVGNSPFRVSEKEGYTDNVGYAFFKKSILEEVGGFDERFIRNQDLEINRRIKKIGGKFYFNPKIRSVYYARSSVKKMMQQAFGNGKWNMILAKKDPKALSLRHTVPFAFVLFLLLTTIGGFLWHPVWIAELAVLGLHFLLGLIFSVKQTKKCGEIIRMPFIFLLLHLSYGMGYFAGLFKKL